MSLSLCSVSKSFGAKCVVHNLDLKVPAGEVFGFLGPNGAGKTTTMRMILDIIKPDNGTIEWQGQGVSLNTAHRFGYLPEERGLYPKMLVSEQLRFFARLRGLSNSQARERIDYWVERFQLGELVKKKANELSKGNQQKVQFILAVLHQPELLILDEPFSGLDPVNVEILKGAFCDLAGEGRTIIFSSHRMEHVEELCSALCIIANGRIVAQGSVDSVRGLTGRQIIHLSLNGSLDFLNAFSIKNPRLRPGRATNIKEVEFDLPAGVNPQEILQLALQNGQVKKFAIGDPSLNDVFITLMGGGTNEA